jgi:hypothetical protein
VAKKVQSVAARVAERDAASISRELTSFGRSSRVFSAATPRLIDKYENKWVAVHDGDVVASADDFKEAAAAVKALGIPLGETMIRRVERNKKTFIL